MGFFGKLASRVPIFVVGMGLIVATGSYRGREAAFAEMPLVGMGLVVVGLMLFAGLKLVGD